MINEEEVRRLPLWKDWIDRNEHRIAHGLTVTMEEMEEALDGIRETHAFNMEVHHIRRELRHRGMNFSQRGLRGAGFHILPPNTNADEMEHLNHDHRRVRASCALGAARSGLRRNRGLFEWPDDAALGGASAPPCVV